MELHQLNKHVWLIEVELDGYNVRGALLLGDNVAIVLDTLSHPHDMLPLLPLIDGRAVTIIYTHADWDHIWGTTGLPYQNARIIGHVTCLERFSTDVPTTLHARQCAEPHEWDAVELIPPNDTFQHEYSLNAGSLTGTLHHLPGHTPDSIIAFFPEHGLLFMGDTVETPFPCLEPQSPLSRWITELRHWERDSRVYRVIPAHGNIGGRAIIQRNIDYLQDLLDGHEPAIPDPLTAFYSKTHQENIHFARGAS